MPTVSTLPIPEITALYAGLLGLMLVYLSAAVIRMRVRHRVGLGDGGHSDLIRASRAQGNFTEHAPLALVLILLVELLGGAPALVHGLGAALVLGRIAHCISIPNEILRLRQVGMVLTFGVLIIAGLWLVVMAFA